MSRNPLKRRALRIIAIQALYQMDICKDLSEFDAVRLALDVLHDEQSFDEEVYSQKLKDIGSADSIAIGMKFNAAGVLNGAKRHRAWLSIQVLRFNCRSK